MRDFLEVVSDIPVASIPYHLIPSEVQWITRDLLSGDNNYTVYLADQTTDVDVDEVLSFLSEHWKGEIERLDEGQAVVSTHSGLEKVRFVNILVTRV